MEEPFRSSRLVPPSWRRCVRNEAGRRLVGSVWETLRITVALRPNANDWRSRSPTKTIGAFCAKWRAYGATSLRRLRRKTQISHLAVGMGPARHAPLPGPSEATLGPSVGAKPVCARREWSAQFRGTPGRIGDIAQISMPQLPRRRSNAARTKTFPSDSLCDFGPHCHHSQQVKLKRAMLFAGG